MKLTTSFVALLALEVWAIGQDIVTLPGTQPLTWTGDLSAKMHEAALRDMDQRIADAPAERTKFWHRDLSSPEAYERSIEANREHFKQVLGVVDARLPVTMERFDSEETRFSIGGVNRFEVWRIRWPVFAGVSGEGLLLKPFGKVRGLVVALPDADQTPEQFVGFAPGLPEDSQMARRLAENNFEVIVPTLIDRSDAGSGNSAVAMTNQPHREWIHRQAYMMGRTLIGLEVQKVLAAVDWLEERRSGDPAIRSVKIGVAGYGEGGLVALYAAAVDPRVQSTLVSGYFKSRQQTWEEPLYRNVWGLLREFGDAEIATLVAPRSLIVEYSSEPKVEGPPAAEADRKSCAAPGNLATPPFAEVEAEFKRIDTLLPPGFQDRQLVHGPDGAPVLPGSVDALVAFARGLSILSTMSVSVQVPVDRRHTFDPAARQLRQVKELETHIQEMIRISNHTRNDAFLYKVFPEYRVEAWNTELGSKKLAPESFVEVAKTYRGKFWEDILGKIDDPLPAPNPRTRKIYDEPKWTGYEVVVDVGGEGFAWGILCVPKDLRPGEKRPVVVCQHGRHGIPQDTITGDKPAYRNFAARLAEQGFITFAPHNLYQKEAYYRTLSRKGNTVGLSMFSVIVRHHEQWLKWLGALPFVDPQRIAFYGLSYGGESAVRIPPLLDGYCLSICSGDFNDWPRKVASTDDRHSFMFTDEWEMPYFNMGNTFSYAELTYLMFPRPFMVERGHHDQVAPDEWVASEYAKTRWFYDQFGLGDRTAIEFFDGGHTINGQGTFEFLRRHLNWPELAK